MNEIIASAWARLPDYLSGHVALSAAALALGVAISLPLAIAARGNVALRWIALTSASIVQTIPSLALLALFYPILLGLSHLSANWLGLHFSALGFLPAFLALALYAMLPIVRNTIVGLAGGDADAVDAARGMGMTDTQVLWRIELPLAAPVIIAGVRTSAVWVIGTATLATPVGQTTLGNYIFTGLQTENWVFVVFGCLASALLALVVDQTIALIERGFAKRDRRRVVGGVAALAAGALMALAPSFVSERPHYVIGAKTFSEQLILARLLADRLQAAGESAETRTGLGSSIILRALSEGDIDAYIEYTGTIWANDMGHSDNPGRAAVNAQVRDWLMRTRGVSVLGGLGFENAYALAMRRDRAAALHATAIGDLSTSAPNLRIGGDYEFFGRPEWRAIQSAYGVRFRQERTYQPTFMYRALASGDVDVISAYSSDGRVAADDLVVLADPSQAIPPYDAIVLISPRRSHDAVMRAALTPLVGAIPVSRMQRANELVDREQDKKTPAAAAQWLWAQIRPR